MELLSDSILEEFTNPLTFRHLSVNPPKETFLYFPKEKELIDIDILNRRHSFRKIFEGAIEYTEFENEQLILFRQELNFYNSELNSSVDNSLCLRYLYSSMFDHSIAIKFITDHFEWRKNLFPQFLTIIHKEILNSGFIYILGRDNRFRPLIVINPEIYLRKIEKFRIEEIIYSLIYLLEYIIHNLMISGKVENWNVICDVSNCSIISIPKELGIILKTLCNNYRCRLYSMYLLNLSSYLSMIWKAIRTMLNPITEKKIKLLQGEDCEELFKCINRSQIEKKFGGSVDNIESHFFPPIFPSKEYFTSNDNTNDILINEEKNLNLININSNIKQSPPLIRKDSCFTFHASYLTCKKSVVSIYEEAKSSYLSKMNDEESVYEDLSEILPKSLNLNKISLDDNIDYIQSDYQNTIKLSNENNDVNLAREKSFEVDSVNTNITHHRKI